MLKKTCDVLILIEHIARELEVAVLIKKFMEEKGFYVIIDSIKFHKESIVLSYKANIIIVPWAYSNKEIDLFRNFLFCKDNVIILNMHHEQISNSGSDSFILPQDDAKDILHLSWGKEFSDKLLSVGCKKDTIIECGNPRLDFYKMKLKNISKSKEELSVKYKIDKSKRWILFIANSFHLLSEFQLKENLEKGVDLEEQRISSINNRKYFLEYVDKYLSKYDDVELIYRPHPSLCHIDKNEKDIIELSNRYDNFRCIYGESIRDWIINCDVSISFHSTSIIESCVANKEFYLFRVDELKPDKDYDFFVNYEYTIRDYDYFEKCVKGKLDFSYNKFLEYIDNKLYLNPKIYSCEIICDFLETIHKEHKYSNIKFKYNNYIKTLLISYIKKIFYIIFKNTIIEKKILDKNDLRFYNLFFKGDDYLSYDKILKIEDSVKKIFDDGEV